MQDMYVVHAQLHPSPHVMPYYGPTKLFQRLRLKPTVSQSFPSDLLSLGQDLDLSGENLINYYLDHSLEYLPHHFW